MAYQRGAMTRQFIEEDIDMADANITIYLRSSKKYELKQNNYLTTFWQSAKN